MIEKVRIDYIDLLKGFCILWIIWIHTYHPSFIQGPYRIPLFFFLSGIFFKDCNYKLFMAKRINSLLIPFFFFYVLSCGMKMLVSAFPFYSFNISSFLELFHLEPGHDYLTINVPLWFLLCIFCIHLIYRILKRGGQYLVVAVAFMAIFLKNTILAWGTPFMINNALYWISFFTIGNITGKKFIGVLQNGGKRNISLTVMCVMFIASCILHELSVVDVRLPDKVALYDVNVYTPELIIQNILLHLRTFSFIYLMIVLFSFFNGNKKLDFLRFFGKNSLIVLGTHFFFVKFLERIIYKFTGIEDSIPLGILIFIVVTLIVYICIIILNLFFPYCVGKKEVIKTECL